VNRIFLISNLIIFFDSRYNGQVATPPGNFHESPTEYYLNTLQTSMANANITLPSQGNILCSMFLVKL
jgi:hypothetical protein